MPKLGIESKVYRNTGTYGSPVWEEITAVRDATMNVNWDTVEAPSRASRVKKKAKVMVDIDTALSVKADDADEGYIALWDACVSEDESIDVLVLNGDKADNGVRGFRYDALVTSATEDQGIANAVYDDMNLTPDAFGVNPPKYAVVASGAPVFTAL